MSKHVAVLMGGWSAEREISLRSGKACADAAERAGFRVTRIDVDRNVASRLAEVKPDAALNLLRFIAGKELTCAVMGDRALDVIEIVPTVKFYDFEAKYAPGGSKHVLPAILKPNVYQEVRRLALQAHQALGCRGVSRADFRFDDR